MTGGDSIDWTVQDWDDLIPRLLLLAVPLLTRPAAPGRRSDSAPDPSEAQDYVDHAVAEAVSGRRPWDPDRNTLYAHLAELVVGSIPDSAGPVQRPADPGEAAESEPDAAWRSDRRGLLDHIYDREEKLGEMASLILLENCLGTVELSDALEVGPLEISHMRQRMKHEVRDYLARHAGEAWGTSGSPARQLFLHLADEELLEDLSIDEIGDDLAALGVDPAKPIARAAKRAGTPATVPPPPPPEPLPEPPPEPVLAARTDDPPMPEDESEPAGPDTTPGYRVTQPGVDLMADMRIRPSSTPEPRKRRGVGGIVFAVGLLAAVAAGGVAATILWPEIADPDRLMAMIDPGTAPEAGSPAEAGVDSADGPAVDGPAAAEGESFVPAGAEITVGRIEPVPPPAPPPVPVEARPAPAPAPVAVAPVPQPAPEPAVESAPVPEAGAGAGRPLNIIERPAPAPVQEARLPADVARPFTAPPSIVAIVPVERDLLAASGTGVTSSRSRGGRSADETRLLSRIEEAQGTVGEQAIAALVTLQSTEGSFDAMILQRPEEAGRTIADADPALIPILGDTAHLFELVRLP